MKALLHRIYHCTNHNSIIGAILEYDINQVYIFHYFFLNAISIEAEIGTILRVKRGGGV